MGWLHRTLDAFARTRVYELECPRARRPCARWAAEHAQSRARRTGGPDAAGLARNEGRRRQGWPGHVEREERDPAVDDRRAQSHRYLGRQAAGAAGDSWAVRR